MELLLILIYVSICYAVFKIFRIPVNQWSLATAVLGEIVGIVLILLVVALNHRHQPPPADRQAGHADPSLRPPNHARATAGP